MQYTEKEIRAACTRAGVPVEAAAQFVRHFGAVVNELAEPYTELVDGEAIDQTTEDDDA